MGEEQLPILKGILKGVVAYHNAPVRFGRVPKREKARILAAMQSQQHNSCGGNLQSQQQLSHNNQQLLMQSNITQSTTTTSGDNSAPSQLARSSPLLHHGLSAMTTPHNNNNNNSGKLYVNQQQLQQQQKSWTTGNAQQNGCAGVNGAATGGVAGPGSSQQSADGFAHVGSLLDDAHRLQQSVTRAHLDTCEFTGDRVREMQARARQCPAYSAPTLACPLNPAPELQSEKEFSQRFAHVIRGVIDFAGLIPGFRLLCQDDKFTLLKSGLFDALFVRLICMFDSHNSSVVCLNGQILQRDSIQSNSTNAKYLVDSTFEFADRINGMRLTDSEVALFSALVLITPDRAGLKNPQFVERMHDSLIRALELSAQRTRPLAECRDFVRNLLDILPDLRTLSTLHTEKLVVFRTEHKEQLLRQQLEHDTPPLVTSQSHNVSTTTSAIYKDHINSVAASSSLLTSQSPLLAASLTSSQGVTACPRLRANSGSSGDEEFASRLAQNGLTITPIGQRDPRYRKLDSPTDSGIESGNEKPDHKINNLSSNCSSPRSITTQQDLLQSHNTGAGTVPSTNNTTEDMPVLKRVLQAPPLYDTNSLMDEAYKPHKKFRAMRQKDSLITTNHHHNYSHQDYNTADQTNPRLQPGNVGQQPQQLQQTISQPIIQSQLQLHLTRPLLQQQQQQQSNLSTTHSELARTLRSEPRMSAEQIKRADIIQNYLARQDRTSPPSNGANNCPFNGQQSSTQNWTSVIRSPSRYFQSPHSTLSPSPELRGAVSSNDSRGSSNDSPTTMHVNLLSTATINSSVVSPGSRDQDFIMKSAALLKDRLSPAAVASCGDDNKSLTVVSSGKDAVGGVVLQNGAGLLGDAPLNLSTKTPSPQPQNFLLQSRLLQA